MAANEDIERKAMMGELEALHAAWRDAEEIAAIADELFSDGVLEEFKRQYYERIAAGDATVASGGNASSARVRDLIRARQRSGSSSVSRRSIRGNRLPRSAASTGGLQRLAPHASPEPS